MVKQFISMQNEEEKMKYQVVLKAPRDMIETDYLNGANTLCEERNGTKYGIWFDSLEEAITWGSL